MRVFIRWISMRKMGWGGRSRRLFRLTEYEWPLKNMFTISNDYIDMKREKRLRV
jgi:hypothetical protein